MQHSLLSVCLCLCLLSLSHTWCASHVVYSFTPLLVYPFPAPRSITIPIVSRFPFCKEICGKTDEKNSISMAHSSKFLRTYPKFYFFFSGWQSVFPLVAFLQLFFLNCCGDIFTLHSQCALWILHHLPALIYVRLTKNIIGLLSSISNLCKCVCLSLSVCVCVGLCRS